MKRTRLTVAVILGCITASTLLLHAQPGSLDATFNPGGGPNSVVRSVVTQPDGKVLILGGFTQVNGVATRNGIARLNSDGSLDSGFDTGSGFGGSQQILCMNLLGNGKILVAGTYDSINGLPYHSIARLGTNGNVDTTFTSIATLGNTPVFNCVAVHTNGQILVGGLFANGSRNIARFNSDGSLDNSFTPSGGNYVNSVAVQSDGKVLIGGDFSAINGTNASHLARLNTNGSLDTNFNCVPVTSGSPAFSTILLQSDEKILLGGYFVSINGYTRYNIARLNPDGTVDVTFNPGEAARMAGSGYVYSVALQGDGKILVGGGDSLGGNASAARIIRLNTNGVLDVIFNSSPSNTVNAVALQADGKPLIGGKFSKVGGTNINYIARLNSDSSATTLTLLNPQVYFGAYVQGTVSNSYRIEWTTNFNTPALWSPLFNVTLETNPQFILDPTPATGVRFYRAVQVSP